MTQTDEHGPKKEDTTTLLVDMQQRFLNAVAHDLESALQGLMAQGDQLIRETSKPDPDLRRIAYSAGEIVAVAEMLSEMTKNLRSGPFLRPSRPIDATEVVREVVALLARKAETNHISIEIQVSAEDTRLMVMATEPLLRQVVYNLLDNAIKYSYRSPESAAYVRVILRRMDEDMELEVQNVGLLIAPDEIEQVFQAFFRGSAGMRHSPQGTGLGLFVSRKVLMAEGGSLDIVSEPVTPDGQALTRAIARLPIAQKRG